MDASSVSLRSMKRQATVILGQYFKSVSGSTIPSDTTRMGFQYKEFLELRKDLKSESSSTAFATELLAKVIVHATKSVDGDCIVATTKGLKLHLDKLGETSRRSHSANRVDALTVRQYILRKFPALATRRENSIPFIRLMEVNEDGALEVWDLFRQGVTVDGEHVTVRHSTVTPSNIVTTDATIDEIALCSLLESQEENPFTPVDTLERHLSELRRPSNPTL